MKKLAAIAVLALFFGFLALSYAGEPREFISDQMPEEVQKLIDSTELVKIGQKGISTAGNDVLDYGIVYLAIPENYIAAVTEEKEPTPDVTVLWRLTPVKDENGNIVDYSGEFVSVIFRIENLRWFKNAEVKAVFEKATK